MEGRGRATVYAGGWSDYQAQRGETAAPARAEKPKAAPSKPAKETPKAQPKPGLTFTEKHRLEALPDEIDRLTAEIGKLEDFLADPDLYHSAPVKFQKASEALAERQALLLAAEEEWLELEEKASA